MGAQKVGDRGIKSCTRRQGALLREGFERAGGREGIRDRRAWQEATRVRVCCGFLAHLRQGLMTSSGRFVRDFRTRPAGLEKGRGTMAFSRLVGRELCPSGRWLWEDWTFGGGEKASPEPGACVRRKLAAC